MHYALRVTESRSSFPHREDMSDRISSNRRLRCVDLPIVGDVRGSHFMVGIEYVADKQRKTPFDPSVRVAERVFEACRDQGLIVRPIGNQTVLSLIMTRAQTAFLRFCVVIECPRSSSAALDPGAWRPAA